MNCKHFTYASKVSCYACVQHVCTLSVGCLRNLLEESNDLSCCAGQITAADAVKGACEDVKQVCGHVSSVFSAAVQQMQARHDMQR